jgi:hypothetical protein
VGTTCQSPRIVPVPAPARRGPGGRGWLRRLLAGLAGFLAAAGALGQTSREYDLKAAFLFNFAQFVDWPAAAFPEPDAPFVIGVLGEDPFGSALDEIVRHETIEGRPFTVQRFRTLEELEDARCQVLFVSRSEAARLEHVLAALAGRSVLTVGDVRQFNASGGIVQLLLVNQKVRVRINVDAAQRERLDISSKLLRVAEVVGDPRRGR